MNPIGTALLAKHFREDRELLDAFGTRAASLGIALYWLGRFHAKLLENNPELAESHVSLMKSYAKHAQKDAGIRHYVQGLVGITQPGESSCLFGVMTPECVPELADIFDELSNAVNSAGKDQE